MIFPLLFKMDGKRQCKGCGTPVVKPILCEICGLAAHPGCMGRTGHPFSDGKFMGCDSASSASVGLGSEALFSRLQTMFREEFKSFREEVLRLYREEFEKINLELRSLRERVSVMEKVESSSAHIEGPSIITEEVIGEIAERERRSSSLIFFNLAESGSSAEQGLSETDDLARVNEVLSVIKPMDPPKVRVERLGKKSDHSERPIRVSFSSGSEALTILKGKRSYSGPATIRKDLTLKQRQLYKDLRQQLESLKKNGVTNKTIRYRNGSPTIVDINVNSRKKN